MLELAHLIHPFANDCVFVTAVSELRVTGLKHDLWG